MVLGIMTSKDENPVKADFPYTRSNVFLMMRFNKTKQHKKISDVISSVLAEYSLNQIRADSKQYHNELWTNVKSCMDASDYGVAVFEQIDQRDINPNVSLELGYMLAQGKKCLLLKEERVPVLQSDLVGHLYREFDSYEIKKTVIPEVRNWLRDLGFIKRSDERMIVFVSGGGTCRCAMAKAMTKKIVEKYQLNFKLRVESCAKGTKTSQGGTHDNPDDGATDGARQSIKKLFGEDLLADHRSMILTNAIMEEADLILVMDKGLSKGIKDNPKTREKTEVFKRFFGLEGDIKDPWEGEDDGKNETEAQRCERYERYDKCAIEIKEVLELEDSIEKIKCFFGENQK